MSPGYFIMFLMMFAVLSVFCNVVSEATQPVTADDLGIMQGMMQPETTQTSGEGGSVMAFVNVGASVLNYFLQSLMADYAFFYDYNTVTGTRTPNEFMWIRYVFFWPLSVGFIICIALTFRYFLSR